MSGGHTTSRNPGEEAAMTNCDSVFAVVEILETLGIVLTRMIGEAERAGDERGTTELLTAKQRILDATRALGPNRGSAYLPSAPAIPREC